MLTAATMMRLSASRAPSLLSSSLLSRHHPLRVCTCCAVTAIAAERKGSAAVSRPANFILYPKEDKEERRLIYYCRSQRCEYTEPADDPFVFRNQVVKTRNVNLDHILSAVANDPTLQRSQIECPKCSHDEAVLIQSTQSVKSNKLTLIMVCCNELCGHKWTDDDR